jgi:hypothetical protein
VPHPSTRYRLRRIWLIVAALALLGVPYTALRGQQTRRMHGRVSLSSGAPAAHARVQVTVEEGRTVEARTDTGGRYSIDLPGRGRRFVVSADAPGSLSATRVLAGSAGDVDFRVDMVLQVHVVALDPLRVRVPPLTVASATRWAPGSVEQSRLGVTLQRDPLDADPLSALTADQTGVARTPSPDGLGLSLAGQSPDQTRLTLDGSTLPGVVIPREAVAAVNTLTQTFDVSKGQFTGGQIDVRTVKGSNDRGVTMRLERTDRRLQYGGFPAELAPGASRVALDAGAGGALIRDRLFVSGAVTASRTSAATATLEDLSPAALRRLGVDPDSVGRLLQVAGSIGDRTRRSSVAESTLGSGLVRFDLALGRATSAMLRVNAQRSESPLYRSPLALGGLSAEQRGTILGALSQFAFGGGLVANELRVQGTVSSRSTSARDPSPAGLVEIGSTSGDGLVPSLVWFAGNPAAQRDIRQRLLELRDEIVLVAPDRSHRLRLGLEMAAQDVRSLPALGSGSFTFRSIDDLAAGRPAVFSRPLSTKPQEANARRWTVFLDDRWNARGAQLSYGLRIERSLYGSEGDANPDVLARFGHEPGLVPSGWTVSPRAGFALQARLPWDRAPGARTELQGGAGLFVGTLPFPELAAAASDRGAADAESLVCIGAAAPAPDWASYRLHPGTIPTQCADGSAGAASRLAQATIFGPGFVLPRAWRASLAGQGIAPGGIFWRVTAMGLRNTALPVALDRNLRPEPAFRNGAEGGRAGYASLDQIDPATGLVSPVASRRFGELGIVREITSAGGAQTVQLSASASRSYGTGSYQLGYTWTDGQEVVGPVTSPGGAAASAGMDALHPEVAAAPYTPRHMLSASWEWRRSAGFAAGFVARLSSGTPFTPMVRGDVNGDGLANDRAFVFRPGTASPGPAEEIASLLSEAPGRIQGCLSAQFGRVAAPYSCWTSWWLSLDLRARLQAGPRLPRSISRRLTVWVVARNVTAGLDGLVHGEDRLRGWGQPAATDNTLLIVRGFDRDTRQFQYTVNPRFGQVPAAAIQQRTPFSVSIQARIVLGRDRVEAAFQRVIDAGSDRDQAYTPGNLRAHFDRQIPNTAAAILALNGPRRLELTPEQAERLQHVADSVSARRADLLEALVQHVLSAQLEGAGAPELHQLATDAVALRKALVTTTHSILSTRQWRKLPSELRSEDSRFALFPPERITSPMEY